MQQIVDELAHAARAGANAIEIMALSRAQPIARIFVERLREARDCAQRRAQVVRHGIAEGLELRIKRLELANVIAQLVILHGEPAGGAPERSIEAANLVFPLGQPRGRQRLSDRELPGHLFEFLHARDNAREEEGRRDHAADDADGQARKHDDGMGAVSGAKLVGVERVLSLFEGDVRGDDGEERNRGERDDEAALAPQRLVSPPIPKPSPFHRRFTIHA